MKFSDFEENIKYFNYKPENNKHSNPIKYQFSKTDKITPIKVTYSTKENNEQIKKTISDEIVINNAKTYLTYHCENCLPNDSNTGVSVKSGILWKKAEHELVFVCPDGYAIPDGAAVPARGKELNMIHAGVVTARYITLDKNENLVDDGRSKSAIYSIANSVKWNGYNNVTKFMCIPNKNVTEYKLLSLIKLLIE